MAERKQNEGVNVKLDKDAYELAKRNADRVGLSVTQYITSLVHIANNAECERK